MVCVFSVPAVIVTDTRIATSGAAELRCSETDGQFHFSLNQSANTLLSLSIWNEMVKCEVERQAGVRMSC